MEKPRTSMGTIDLHVLVFTRKTQRESSILPKCFIEGLRSALNAGMTAEQIAASLMIMAGFHNIREMDTPELIGRTKEVMGAIQRYDAYEDALDCLEE